MSKEITVIGYVIKANGDTVPLDSLSDDERSSFMLSIDERLSKVMSEYYSQHPERALRLGTKENKHGKHDNVGSGDIPKLEELR